MLFIYCLWRQHNRTLSSWLVMSGSAQFSHLVVSDSLQLHGLQHARLPCPSPKLGAWWNSCPLTRWCHPTISSSVAPFSPCLQSFPTSGSFLMSQLFEFSSVQFSSVTQSCLTLCNPMDHSMTGLPVHHQLLEFTHSCPLSQWCHPTTSSSVFPFSSYPQSFPASGSFQMNQLFSSGGQSIGVSASILVLPMNTQDWSPLGWTGLITLQSKGLSRVFTNTTVQKHRFFSTQLSL